MKERLTGAIILVAVLVLLVPELLSGPGPRRTGQPAGTEETPLRSYTIDLAEDAAKRNAPAPATSSSVGPEPAVEAPIDLAEDAEAQAGVGSDALPPEAVAAPAVPPEATGATMAHAAPDDERHLRGQPDGSGADSAAAAPVPRAAEKPRGDDDRPRSAFGPNAVSRSAAQPARASERASAKGWAVQLGVFASRENAERLAKEVKGKGYPVSVNETSGNGKRLWRVRVGPEPDRSAAVALGAKLRAAGHQGAVVSYP